MNTPLKLLKLRSVLVFIVAMTASCQSFKHRTPSQDTNLNTSTVLTPIEIIKEDPEITVNDKIEFDFIHTQQNCRVASDPQLEVFHKKTFCANINNDDLKSTTELSGMVKKAIEQLDSVLMDPENSKISVAYFSFSNKSIQRKFCELSSKGAKVRVFLDNSSAGQIDELIMQNPACLDSNGKLNIKLSYLGGHTSSSNGGIWQLHHNKFLMIEVPNQKVRLNFSSGNLSSFGTSLHLDHWVMLRAPATTNLVRAHQCVMQGLEAAAEKSKDEETSGQLIGQAYITQREKCFDENSVTPRASLPDTTIEIAKLLNSEEIAPLFSPNNDKSVEKSFISALNKIPAGGYIYIAVQHFLHPGVSYALTSAAKRGVDVRIIMDDDALRGESEVPNVDVMIKKLIQVKGIQIRFAETNRQAGGNGAMMHNKFAILNGEMTFSGAGHYTNAALNVNWENFYFVNNKNIITNYSKYFYELWTESVDFNYSVSKGKTPSSAPPQLGLQFFNLVK